MPKPSTGKVAGTSHTAKPYKNTAYGYKNSQGGNTTNTVHQNGTAKVFKTYKKATNRVYSTQLPTIPNKAIRKSEYTATKNRANSPSDLRQN